MLERSKRLMMRDPVYLTRRQRELALHALVESLLKRHIEVKIAALDRIHLHLLAGFVDRNPRRWMGIAKKESSHALKVAGCGVEGGVWSTRSHCLPIKDAGHESSVEKYILKHIHKGAQVWAPDSAGAGGPTLQMPTELAPWDPY
ncbi:MAG TPA: hypothetical protein VH518_19400 [Tepidisphaeraceae bacterium]|jgi:hypothetical protein